MTSQAPRAVFVSVGTDIHPFERLLDWVERMIEEGPADVQWHLQHGYSSVRPALTSTAFLDHAQLCEAMAGADVVVCHGGPSTIAEARRLGRRPIVVPRAARLGEHVDDHQERFVRRLARAGLVAHAEDYDRFTQLVLRFLDDPAEAASATGGADPAAAAAAAFGRAVAPLLAPAEPGRRGTGEPRRRGWLAQSIPPATWSPELVRTLEQVLPGASAVPGPGLADCYYALPTSSRARYLVPVGSRAARHAAITGYGRLRPGRQQVLRWAAAQTLTGAWTHVRTGQAVHAPPDLRLHLEQAIGVHDLVLGVPVRSLDPHHKPTVQLLNADGSTVGFCKVATTEPGRGRLAVEHAALVDWAVRPAPGVRVPEVLHYGRWRAAQVLVTAPMPPDARLLPDARLESTFPVLFHVLGAAAVTTLGECPWWSELGRRAASVAATAQAVVGAAGVDAHDQVTARFGDVALTTGRAHGDWVPWNIARTGSQLWTWDLEHCSSDVPLGYDAVHGLVHRALQHTTSGLLPGVERALRHAVPALTELGLPRRAGRAVIAAYCVDLAVGAAEVWAERQEWQRWAEPAALVELCRRAAAGQL